MNNNRQKELLLRIAESDEEAFGELFNFYKVGLYPAIYRTVRDANQAKDLYQDIFLKVWINRRTLVTIENFQGWLFKVAKNIMYDFMKKSAKVQSSTLEFLAEIPHDAANNPVDLLQEKEIQMVLSVAVEHLSSKQREAYDLIKIEGVSRAEAAAKMNISSETVKWHLEQAMRNIRAYCKKHLDYSMMVVFMAVFLR